MELPTQIRERRTAAGMSQEQLAGRVYVSRQTISNWETGKTYPDVESLLLLSEVFDVPIDTLVKGDVAVMNEKLAEESRRMRALVFGVALCCALMITAAPAVGTVAGDGWAYVTLAACFVPGMLCAIQLGRLKKEHDVVGLREVARFMDEQEPDQGSWERRHPKLAVVLSVVIAMAVAVLACELVAWAMGLVLG